MDATAIGAVSLGKGHQPLEQEDTETSVEQERVGIHFTSEWACDSSCIFQIPQNNFDHLIASDP